MSNVQTDPRLTARLIDSLYLDAMVLADEARGYFDGPGRADRETLSALDRVTFSCESLKVTTRLMHVIAWLLHRKALDAGEIDRDTLTSESARLGRAAGTDQPVINAMPEDSRLLIVASIDLYQRVARLDREAAAAAPNHARTLLDRLESAF